MFNAIKECYISAKNSSEYQEESILWLLSAVLDSNPVDTRYAKEYVKLAICHMKDNLDSKLDLSTLASTVGLSKYHFVRTFHHEVGIAPIQYHMQLRLIEARKMLRTGIRPMDVMADLGFYDQSHFIKAFRKIMAITPDLYSRTLREQLA